MAARSGALILLAILASCAPKRVPVGQWVFRDIQTPQGYGYAIGEDGTATLMVRTPEALKRAQDELCKKAICSAEHLGYFYRLDIKPKS